MSTRPLKSDQVNYLVWRYLQESGHAQTAARLQRDWGRADPQRLPFAQHIRTHALVHLLQKGLRYHELETSIDQNGQRKPPSYFFGPESDEVSQGQAGGADDDNDSSTSRKHLREAASAEADAGAQAPSAKRSRRSNGAAVNGSGRRAGGDGMDLDPASGDLAAKRESGPATSATSPASTAANNASVAANPEMDVDFRAATDPGQQVAAGDAKLKQEGDDATDAAAAAADAHDDQPPPMVPTLVNGSSVGVQSEKAAELGPDTGVLTVPGRNVTHALWSPQHPGMLAAAGDALCRLWTLPSATGAAADSPPAANGLARQQPPRPRAIEPSAAVDLNQDSEAYYVTSISWSDDGETLAAAKHPTTPGQRGVLGLYDRNGVDLEEMPGSHDLVLNLIWNPQSRLLLGISHGADGNSSVLAWDARGARVIDTLRLARTVWDAAWVDDRHFLVCGHGYVAKVEVVPTGVNLISERVGDALVGDWSRIKHDIATNSTALAADGSSAVIGLSAGWGWLGTKEAHSADITGLAFQPLTGSAAAAAAAARSSPNPPPRILATSSIDGSIKLWNTSRQLELVHELDSGKACPVMAMAFTPDGFLIAGASAEKVLFFNAETGGLPKAVWRAQDAGWLANGAAHANGNGHAAVENGSGGDVEMADEDEEEEDPVPTLTWDADGKKLVCAVRNQLAIISLRR